MLFPLKSNNKKKKNIISVNQENILMKLKNMIKKLIKF